MENSDKFKSFEDLDVWKHCRELRKKYEKLAKSLPPEEKYRLSDQIVRSSRSTTQNIAEGYGRFYFQENIQFCRISRGSLYELLDHLITCLDNEYIEDKEYSYLRGDTITGIKLVNGYIRYLNIQKDGATTKTKKVNTVNQVINQ